MTEIAEKFKALLLEKIGEKDRPVRSSIKNIIVLRDNFDCNIYCLTSDISKMVSGGFWNFGENAISHYTAPR